MNKEQEFDFIENNQEILEMYFAQNEGRAVLDDDLEDTFENWLESQYPSDLVDIILKEKSKGKDTTLLVERS